MRLLKLYGLYVLTHIAVAIANGLQFIGLYAESRVPLTLATVWLDKVDEIYDELFAEQHFY